MMPEGAWESVALRNQGRPGALTDEWQSESLIRSLLWLALPCKKSRAAFCIMPGLRAPSEDAGIIIVASAKVLVWGRVEVRISVR